MWLISAILAPTPVSALVHSSTLVTAGIFIVLKFTNGCCFSLGCLDFFITLAGLSFFFGCLIMLLQTDVKKIIAVATLCQIMLIITNAMFQSTASFNSFYRLTHNQLIIHGYIKSCFFLVAGIFFIDSRYLQKKKWAGNSFFCSIRHV